MLPWSNGYVQSGLWAAYLNKPCDPSEEIVLQPCSVIDGERTKR